MLYGFTRTVLSIFLDNLNKFLVITVVADSVIDSCDCICEYGFALFSLCMTICNVNTFTDPKIVILRFVTTVQISKISNYPKLITCMICQGCFFFL